ncbi:MAG: EAL domain-containing protein [Chloroflexia bacterium]
MTDELPRGVGDPDRLVSLRATTLLDSPPDETFDRLTRLAVVLLHAPSATVVLIDEDRQFFKSNVGLAEPWASKRETPLSYSFCVHMVASGAPLIIENTRQNPLVRDSLAVTELGVAAYAGIPLKTEDGHVLGGFCVTDRLPRTWTSEEIEILTELAALASVEIKARTAEANLRQSEVRYQALLTAEQRHVQDLSLLDRVRTALMRELNPSRIFRTVVEAIAQTFGYTQVSIYLMHGTGLVMQHQVGYDRWFEKIRLNEGVIGHVGYTGKPMLIEDVQSDPLYRAAQGDVVSEVCVPLLDQGTVIGVLNVESRHGVTLSDADLQLMIALSEHVSSAVWRARLYTESKLATETLRRRNEELAALHETALGLIDQLDSTTLLEAILARAAALIGTNNGYLYVVDPGLQEVVLRAVTGIFVSTIGYRLERGQGLAGQVWATDALITIDDYNAWPGHRADLEWLNIRAIVGIPLHSGTEVIGVLGLSHQQAGRTFGPEETALLERFGELASLALTNAKLYEAAKQELVERKQAEEMLAHLALHDPLTDLPNRTLFNDRLHRGLLTAQRDNKTLALLIMDLDRFKEVNDTLGHYTGDLLLQQVAGRLSQTVRASDTVARLGGDEFAVLLPVAEAKAARRISRKLAKALELPFDLDGHRVGTRGSIGIALYPEHGADAETLMRQADVAMYTAKRRGGGYAVYTMDDDPYNARRMKLIEELHRAIEKDELVLYYQPKVSHKTHRTTGVEALVRWRHPTHGLMLPDQFLSLTEHSGLIEPFSQWIFNAAIRQCREWQEQGLAVPVSVNLLVPDLQDPALSDRITSLLTAWGIDPVMLRMEITEAALMTDAGRALKALHSLHTVGLHIEIDNFGTGNSSLAQLQRLPVDQIKIDRSLVLDMARNESDAVIVRSTIDLGHNLGLTVVAEGVEDQATWDLLTALGCDEGQGFFLSRPVPAEEVARWIRRPILE